MPNPPIIPAAWQPCVDCFVTGTLATSHTPIAKPQRLPTLIAAYPLLLVTASPTPPLNPCPSRPFHRMIKLSCQLANLLLAQDDLVAVQTLQLSSHLLDYPEQLSAQMIATSLQRGRLSLEAPALHCEPSSQ